MNTNPKEKAENIVHDFFTVNVENTSEYGMEFKMAKQCSIILVDEILSNPFSGKNFEYKYHPNSTRVIQQKEYWEKVKEEIIKMK